MQRFDHRDFETSSNRSFGIPRQATRSERGASGRPFPIPLDDRGLQRVYDSYLSNPLAQRAAVCGVIALMVPFASLVTLGMAMAALRRVDHHAWPPRSGRLPAVLGLVASLLGLAIWGLVLIAILSA